MVSDSDHRRRIASNPQEALAGLLLDPRERRRLTSFAGDPGMRVNAVLYRFNRLAPIYHAMPRTCAALGADFGEILRIFWRSSEIEDLQFPSEVARFVAFLQRESSARLVSTRGLAALMAVELAIFELLMLPRRELRSSRAGGEREEVLHPLVRVVAVDVAPESLIAVVETGKPLSECAAGRGGVLVDHRDDPGSLVPLLSRELVECGSPKLPDRISKGGGVPHPSTGRPSPLR
jgi:hypothetical protein